MSEYIKMGILYFVVLLMALVWIYGIYSAAKRINYSLSYEDMVIETICERVNPEHLTVSCE